MSKLLAIVLLAAATAVTALAGSVSPEIDASSGVAALTLLSGAALVLRARRKK